MLRLTVVRFAVLVVVVWSAHSPAAEPAPVQAAPDAAAAPSPTSAVLIVENPPPLPGETAPADADAAVRRRINNHVATLRAGNHINKTIASPNSEIRKTKWFAGSGDPRERIRWLREKIKVRPVPETTLIEISLDAVEDPAERQTILQELTAVYLEQQRQARTLALLDRTQMLNTMRIRFESRMRDLDQEMKELQVRLNIDGGSVGRVGLKEIELTELQTERIRREGEANRLRTELERAQGEAEKGQILDTPATVAALRNDQRLRRLEDRLDDLEIRRAVLAAANRKDPALATVDAEIDATRKKLDSATDGARASLRAAYLADLRARHDAAREAAESLLKRVDNLKNDLGELANAIVKYTNMRDEHQGLRERLKAIKDGIEQIMGMQNSQSTDIRWHMMPERGDVPPG